MLSHRVGARPQPTDPLPLGVAPPPSPAGHQPRLVLTRWRGALGQERAEHLAPALDGPVAEAEQARQARKREVVERLATGIAQDFHSLVQLMLGYTELLQEELAPRTRAHCVAGEVRLSGERAAALASQLLAFLADAEGADLTRSWSRVEAGSGRTADGRRR